MRGLTLFLGALAAVACSTRTPPGRAGRSSHVETPASSVSSAPSADPLRSLRDFENARRAQTDFAHAPTSDVALGTDPYVVRRLPGSTHLVGILRGRSTLVELDASLHEVARLAAPASPSGLAVATTGDVFVVGELSHGVARYTRASPAGGLRAADPMDLPDVLAMRDVATGPEGVIYVVEEHDGRLLTLTPHAHAAGFDRADAKLCHGPVRVKRGLRSVLVDCVLDHAIVVRKVDRAGVPVAEGETRVVHDGPMWGFDAVDAPDGVLLAVGGVEDHPLDRTEGSFGFVDSFVTLYRVSQGQAVKLREVNTSALGLVTPKALELARGARGGLQLTVAGYGADRLAVLEWNADAAGEPTVTTRAAPPGTAMLERLGDGTFAAANPLLDAWVHITPDGASVVHVDDDVSRARASDSRLGEALFFTTLMAPWDKSDGRLSRFTCETCHYEGYADGRTHHTGRGDVHATTKPLLGLFNNRPHFSRALDPDMTTMVNNEFRVAGAKSDHDPWFELSPGDFPWLAELGIQDPVLGPERLRRALMSFLMDFAHRPNPSAFGRTKWTDAERAGAEVFRDKCESCHEARLIADDASTRVPWAKWEELVMAKEGAIVWAHADYEKTGVLPYVNEKGARVVSLRRLYKKYPYFTNGSAKDLASVLDRARLQGKGFFHDGASEGATSLADDEKARLLAFLDLL